MIMGTATMRLQEEEEAASSQHRRVCYFFCVLKHPVRDQVGSSRLRYYSYCACRYVHVSQHPDTAAAAAAAILPRMIVMVSVIDGPPLFLLLLFLSLLFWLRFVFLFGWEEFGCCVLLLVRRMRMRMLIVLLIVLLWRRVMARRNTILRRLEIWAIQGRQLGTGIGTVAGTLLSVRSQRSVPAFASPRWCRRHRHHRHHRCGGGSCFRSGCGVVVVSSSS